MIRSYLQRARSAMKLDGGLTEMAVIAISVVIAVLVVIVIAAGWGLPTHH